VVGAAAGCFAGCCADCFPGTGDDCGPALLNTGLPMIVVISDGKD
jgi:hypothetical protein